MIPLVEWSYGRNKFTGTVVHWGLQDQATYAIVACNENKKFERVWREDLTLTGWKSPVGLGV